MEDLFADRTIRDSRLRRPELAALGAPHRLIGCDLEEADLSGLDLSGWVFEQCDLRRARLAGARCERSLWQSCRGAFADFTGCDLSEARFVACDFNNAMLRRSTLEEARFLRCKCTGADFSEVKAITLHIEETLLIDARLAGLSFRKAQLVRVDFSRSDLRKCDFRMTSFEACSLREAQTHGARFEQADLRGADLGGIGLGDAARFRGATISREQAAQLLAEVGLNVR